MGRESYYSKGSLLNKLKYIFGQIIFLRAQITCIRTFVAYESVHTVTAFAIDAELYHSLWIICHLPKDRQRSKLSVLYKHCPSSISIVINISRAQKFSIENNPFLECSLYLNLP